MKKAALIILVSCVLVISSCTKTSTNQGGTWSFKSSSYTATTFGKTYSAVTVSSQTSLYANNYNTLTISFYNGLPTNNGTFVVKPGVSLDSTNQVAIAVNSYGVSDTLYQATGGNGSQTVSVTVADGKINISGSGIEVANTVTPSDSAIVSFNLVQP